MTRKSAREINGRHMLAIFVIGFGIVIAVNFEMAKLAVTTFTGETVENSYVASQRFNGWLREAAAEKTLGWSVKAERTADGRVRLLSTTLPADAVIKAEVRHPLGGLPDRALAFVPAEKGTWTSTGTLPAGRWLMRIEVTARAHPWRTEIDLR